MEHIFPTAPVCVNVNIYVCCAQIANMCKIFFLRRPLSKYFLQYLALACAAADSRSNKSLDGTVAIIPAAPGLGAAFQSWQEHHYIYKGWRKSSCTYLFTAPICVNVNIHVACEQMCARSFAPPFIQNVFFNMWSLACAAAESRSNKS